MTFLKFLLIMLFLHMVADYNLQGWLATAKQKSWWEENYPDEKYKNDYKCALIEHSFVWTFMIMLPWLIVFPVNEMYYIMFIGNMHCHASVDDFKANQKLINLWQDQLIHIFCILWTCFIMFLN